MAATTAQTPQNANQNHTLSQAQPATQHDPGQTQPRGGVLRRMVGGLVDFGKRSRIVHGTLIGGALGYVGASTLLANWITMAFGSKLTAGAVVAAGTTPFLMPYLLTAAAATAVLGGTIMAGRAILKNRREGNQAMADASLAAAATANPATLTETERGRTLPASLAAA